MIAMSLNEPLPLSARDLLGTSRHPLLTLIFDPITYINTTLSSLLSFPVKKIIATTFSCIARLLI